MHMRNTGNLELPRKFMVELAYPFVGREEEAKVLTLALLAREHVLLVGEPGTAKSALARRAAELLNVRFFKYLLTRYTEPAELFGPLDIKGLQEGVYKRITRGKLPEAEIAFLDEIFNANSAVLNALLSILQERVLYDGYTEIRVPLWTMIGASNRIPDEPELEALYDRMLLRHFTRPVEENKWSELLDAAWNIESGKIPVPQPIMGLAELKQLHQTVLEVDYQPVKTKLIKLYAIFEEKGVHLTDRRKGKALKVIAANAVLSGRTIASEEDLIVLKYVAPRDEDDLDKVLAIIAEELKTPAKYLRELADIENNTRELARIIEGIPEYDPRLVEVHRNLRIARERVLELARESGNEQVESRAQEVVYEIDTLLEKVSRKLGF